MHWPHLNAFTNCKRIFLWVYDLGSWPPFFCDSTKMRKDATMFWNKRVTNASFWPEKAEHKRTLRSWNGLCTVTCYLKALGLKLRTVFAVSDTELKLFVWEGFALCCVSHFLLVCMQRACKSESVFRFTAKKGGVLGSVSQRLRTTLSWT